MVSGKETPVGAMECRFGPMEPNTRESGQMERLTERVSIVFTQENLLTLMETFTMESGGTIRRADTVPTSITMELSMKESGLMITNMERALRHGLTVASMKAITPKARKTDKANIHGKMAAISLATGETIK